MFESVETIPWHEVRHAFGPATDAPRWIRALDSEDEIARNNAVYTFLWDIAFHQYTLYPATPFVIPFVIEALRSRALAERVDGCDSTMKAQLLRFLRLCARGGQQAMFGKPHPRAPTIENAVRAGAATYAQYAGDSAPRVAEDARWLVVWCATGLSVSDDQS